MTATPTAPAKGGGYLDFSNLRGDLFGGVTAGVVALPLALAFGDASGAGPIAGLWGAIFVGFLAALFGGTGSQISGPTGPMIVVFAGVFASFSGDPGLVFGAVVLAGLLQVVFGVLRLGQYVRLVPYPVVSGFMTGIGAIIISLQAARFFGHEPAGGGTVAALRAIPEAVLNPNPAALAVGAAALAIVFLWPKALGKWAPAPLAALIVGTLLSLAIPGAPVLGTIPTGFPDFVMPAFSAETLPVAVKAAAILAALGAIDSLLTSLVADNLTRTKHNSDRELIGQGIGNTVAGLFGAIPGAGATMRTVANVRSGGRTRISGMAHSLLLLAVVVSLAPLAARIPEAVLAGILVKVGYDIVDFPYLRQAHRGPRWDLLLMALVLGLTVFVDLITAVAVGVVLGALAFVKQLADVQLKALASVHHEPESEEEHAILERAGRRIGVIEFFGPLSFGAAADAAHRIRESAKGGVEALVLDFSEMPFIDVSAARAVESIAMDARTEGRALYAAGLTRRVGDVLAALGGDEYLPAARRYAVRIDAVRAAAADLGVTDPAGASGLATAPARV